MALDLQFVLFDDGGGFYAMSGGHKIGEITFVRAGLDRMIIDHTAVDAPYRNAGVGCALVGRAVEFARDQGRKIIPLCPFALAMFNRHPEFNDVRLMHAH